VRHYAAKWGEVVVSFSIDFGFYDWSGLFKLGYIRQPYSPPPPHSTQQSHARAMPPHTRSLQYAAEFPLAHFLRTCVGNLLDVGLSIEDCDKLAVVSKDTRAFVSTNACWLEVYAALDQDFQITRPTEFTVGYRPYPDPREDSEYESQES
jgi:hypothetical protein